MEDKQQLMAHKNRILSIADPVEREIECCLWGMEFLADYQKQLEPNKPEKVIKYHNMPKDDRKKLNKDPQNSDDFWRDPEVFGYFEEYKQIQNTNKSNLMWLKHMKETLKNTIHEAKIDKAIATHEGGELIAWDD